MTVSRILATETRQQPRTIKCDCCDLPAATVRSGVLVITVRHHGQRHTTLLSVRELIALLQEAA